MFVEKSILSNISQEFYVPPLVSEGQTGLEFNAQLHL